MQNPLTYDRRTQAMDAVFFKMGISYDRDIRNLLLKTEESMHGLGFPLDVASILNGTVDHPYLNFGKSGSDKKMFEPTKLWCGQSTFKILFEDKTDPKIAIRLVVNSETMFWDIFQYGGECTDSTSRYMRNHMRQGLPDASKTKEVVYKSFIKMFKKQKGWKKTRKSVNDMFPYEDRARNLYGDDMLSDEPTVTYTCGNDADLKFAIMTYIDGQVNLRFPVAGHGVKYWEWNARKPLPVPPTASGRKH